MRLIFIKIKSTAVISAVLFLLLFTQCAKDDEATSPTPTTPSDPKLRFVADWTCTEVSRRDAAAQPFQIHMLNGSGDSLTMENCYALGFANKAKLIVYGDSLKFAPNNQQIGTGVFLINGKGKLTNSSTIKLTYIIDDGNPIKDTVDATFSK